MTRLRHGFSVGQVTWRLRITSGSTEPLLPVNGGRSLTPGTGSANVRLVADVRRPLRLAAQTTGSAPIFVLAIIATILVVTLWLLVWRNR